MEQSLTITQESGEDTESQEDEVGSEELVGLDENNQFNAIPTLEQDEEMDPDD